MSVNLYSFVEHPFTDKAYFNYDKFKDIVYKAQRLMDDIVDLEEEKINLILQKIEKDPEPTEIKSVEKNLWLKIKKKLLEGRRTGLSAIGLADCFASLNITYSSEQSITLAEEIYKQFAITAYKSSIDMAKERGCFPIWNKTVEKDNPFLQKVVYSLHYPDNTMGSLNGHGKFGRRNIACLTIPPSGTISIMAGISSGIEPVYQLYYKRRYKILENTDEKKAYDFVDQNGDKWKEYIVYHPKFDEWLTSLRDNKPFYNNYEDYAKISPYYKSTAYEIDPIQRVKLQAAIQKYIDNSISSTINLPESTTEEQVSELYMKAWELGCKGITVYRDNCRTGVLVSVDKSQKRPKSMICNIHNTKAGGKNYLVLIGLKDDKPYEIFVKPSEFEKAYVIDPQGEIIKLKSKHYILRTPSTEIDLTTNLPNDQALITRLVSTMLKNDNFKIEDIIEQVEKAEGDLTTFGKVITRILKRYLADGTHSTELCPECGNKILYKDGCKSCTCGYSKCG
jgi:ribonucleoside-diphosphate reductase alpha chain